MNHKINLLLDMDGVLADFIGGMCRAHNRKSPYTNLDNAGKWAIDKLWNMSSDQFWSVADIDFWSGLDKTDICDQLLDTVLSLNTNLYIATAPPDIRKGSCVSGKELWLKRNMPKSAKYKVIYTCAKHLMANHNNILIDDGDHNIEAWRNMYRTQYSNVELEEFEGYHCNFIRVPRMWNCEHSLSNDTLKIVLDRIKDIYEPITY